MTPAVARRSRRPVPAALVALLLLAGCGAVPEHQGLTTRFVQSATVRDIAAERVPAISRGQAAGAQLNLSGRRNRAAAEFGGALLATGRLPTPETERYLERIRDRLLRHWPHGRPAPVPRIEVTGSQRLAAHALSDGTIQVTLGLLRQAGSEDEVAFALGHELGHLLLHHQLRRQEQVDTAENVGETLSQLAALGGWLSDARIAGGASNPRLVGGTSAGSREVMQQAALGRATLGEAMVTLIDPGWSRTQEQQADMLGLDLMVDAGYDPRHAQGIFERLIQDRESAQREVQSFSTLMQQAASQAGGGRGLGNIGQAARAMLTNAWRDGLHAARTSFRERHPEPKDREQWAAEYRDRWYEEALPKAPETAPLERLRGTRDYQRASRAMERAHASHAARDAGDQAGALRMAQSAVAEAPDWWGAQYSLALVHLGASRGPAARDALARSLRLGGAPYAVHALLADQEANAGNRAGALGALDLAASQFGYRNLVLPDRIALLRRFGDRQAMQADLATCARDSNPRLRDKCAAAARGNDDAS